MPWRRDRLPTSVFMGFPSGSNCKEFTCNAGDLGLIPELGRSLGGGHGNPLQYPCLEESPWTEEPGLQLQRSQGYSHKESDTTEQLSSLFGSLKIQFKCKMLSLPTMYQNIGSRSMRNFFILPAPAPLTARSPKFPASRKPGTQKMLIT